MPDQAIIPNKVYNVKEAAEVLGATPLTIAEYCRLGKIKGQKIGQWRMLGQALIDFLLGKSQEQPPEKTK